MAKENPHDAARRKQHPVTIVKPKPIKTVKAPPRRKKR
jgi:hypothetical protein